MAMTSLLFLNHYTVVLLTFIKNSVMLGANPQDMTALSIDYVIDI